MQDGLNPFEQEAQLSPRDRASATHYTGGEVNALSAVRQHKMHRLQTFAFEKYCNLESQVTGHSRLLEITSFDISY